MDEKKLKNPKNWGKKLQQKMKNLRELKTVGKEKEGEKELWLRLKELKRFACNLNLSFYHTYARK